MKDADASSSDDTPIPDLLKKLLDDVGSPREFRASYQVFKDGRCPDAPYSLLEALDVDKELLSPTAKEALEALEAAPATTEWSDFKWRLTAFTCIQDIFESLFYKPEVTPIIFQQYYFYYESRTILSESILCGLNGFSIAAQALLRLFLEFSVLQNYYFRLTKEAQSYAVVEKYFETGVHPSWHTVLKKALPKDEFAKPIRYRIQSHLSGLSESIIHPYHPDLSPLQHKKPGSAHSFEGLHFWSVTDMVLEAALWAYYVNLPLLFHPYNLLRKFGYDGPVGMLIDEQGGACIKKSLTPDDYQLFVDYSLRQQETLQMLDWAKGYPDLSDEEIRKTWDYADREYPGLWEGYGEVMARMRAIKVGLALKKPSKEKPLSSEFINSLRSLNGWLRIMDRGKKGKNKATYMP